MLIVLLVASKIYVFDLLNQTILSNTSVHIQELASVGSSTDEISGETSLKREQGFYMVLLRKRSLTGKRQTVDASFFYSRHGFFTCLNMFEHV